MYVVDIPDYFFHDVSAYVDGVVFEMLGEVADSLFTTAYCIGQAMRIIPRRTNVTYIKEE